MSDLVAPEPSAADDEKPRRPTHSPLMFVRMLIMVPVTILVLFAGAQFVQLNSALVNTSSTTSTSSGS